MINPFVDFLRWVVVAQIENDCENDAVFECNKTPVSRRSSASTNNNNQVLGEPASPKTVRSR